MQSDIFNFCNEIFWFQMYWGIKIPIFPFTLPIIFTTVLCATTLSVIVVVREIVHVRHNVLLIWCVGTFLKLGEYGCRSGVLMTRGLGRSF